MEGEKGYEEAWSVASTTDGIRPATQAEVGLWLKGHPKDARFAQSCQVGGKTIKLPKTADGFIIQEEP
jgi:hypothetical protein